MSIITSFNTSQNFWIVNPQFQHVSPFKQLHDSDKTRMKSGSSKKMWFISQALDDNTQNIFKNTVFEERVNTLSKDYMEDPNYYSKNEQDLQQYMDTYKSLHSTSARKALDEWNRKILDRSQFILKTAYTMDEFKLDKKTNKFVKIAGTAKMLDDMMKNSKQIYDLYHKILEELEKEDESSIVKGGQNLSLSDKQLI